MKLDILAVGAHPDDVEMSCGGTLLKQVSKNQVVGILNLTQGQMGTRGNPEIRLQESKKASKIIGAKINLNLGFDDVFFKNDKTHQIRIVEIIRFYKPNLVLCNAPKDRHPDHGKASKLVETACFLSGLPKIETTYKGKPQESYRPKNVFNYIQDYYIKPNFVIDVSAFVEKKMKAIKTYTSQFYDPNSKENKTPISSKEFLQFLKGRMREMGRNINCEFAEGFISKKIIGLNDITKID